MSISTNENSTGQNALRVSKCNLKFIIEYLRWYNYRTLETIRTNSGNIKLLNVRVETFYKN